MVRIIPWSLPPIAGGSQGGYTPAPTPTPTPSGTYYDFTNAVISNVGTPNVIAVHRKTGDYSIYGGSKCTGITTDTIVGVSQVTATITIEYYGSEYTLVVGLDVTDPNVMVSVISCTDLYYNETRTYTITKIAFAVYGSNGTVEQTETIEVGA